MRMSWWEGRSVALAAGVLLAGACSALPVGDLRATGTIALQGGPFVVGKPCSGEGDASIVADGQPIYVEGTDAQGPIATGTIGPGEASSSTLCLLPFAVAHIPRGFDQYRVTVGNPDVGVLGTLEHLDERTVALPLTVTVAAPGS